MKKGFFQSMDAVIALFIIAGLFIFLSSMYSSDVQHRSLSVNSQDLVNVLSVIKVGDSKSNVIQDLIIQNKISDRQKDSSLLEYISELWVLEEHEKVELILQEITSNIFDDNYGISFYLDDQLLFYKDNGNLINFTRSSSSITVTGILKDQISKGISVRSFLTGIGNKLTSEYIFFGGFEGQGNISKRGAKLPLDAEVVEFIFEAYVGTNFSFYLNGNYCADLQFYDVGVNSTIYNLMDCKGYLLYGHENLFEFKTIENKNNAFIGGGFIEIKFNTKSFSTNINFNHSIYQFPGISGLINLYSSFDVPGEMKSMEIFIRYEMNSSNINNEPFFLQIGDKKVFVDNSFIGENSVLISNEDLLSILNYDDFNYNTVPIRLGFENLSYSIEFEEGNADVILITDLSGSMNRCVHNNNNCGPSCPGLGCRFDLSIHLAKEFAENLLSIEGNRLGLVTYSDHGINEHYLSTHLDSLTQTIDGFQIGGATCICCAIRQSRIMLEQESNDSRQKFIIVMTDGIANIRCNPFDLNDTNGCGYEWCGGFFSCGGCHHYVSPCGGCLTYNNQCGDFISDGAKDDAIWDAGFAHSTTGAQVDVIGFGADAIGCLYAVESLDEIAQAGNGTSYSSANVTGLSEIYETILDEIIEITKTSQIINVSGHLEQMKLYDDSYIFYNYSLDTIKPPAGFITLRFATDHFQTCSSNIYIPDVYIKYALVTSYSSKYWTNYLSINNDVIFNLSEFSMNYNLLGDPFVIMVPSEKINTNEENLFKINIGDSPYNSIGCSPHSRMIYTIMVPTSITQSGIYTIAEGCQWTIEYEEGDFSTFNVPKNYDGDSTCFYTSSNVSFNLNDGIDNAVYRLLKNLDLENNNKLNIRLDTNEFNIETIEIKDIPSLLGPSRFSVRLWK